MTKELIYVYCICQRQPDLNGSTSLTINLERSRRVKDLDSDNNVYTIFQQGLYAVVSKVSEDEFGEANLKRNLANLDWIKEKATTHEKMIESIMKDTCVIPFKFGAIFNSEDSLKIMLKMHTKNFKKNLEDLEGKEEWGIKIYCDIERLKESVIKEDIEVLIIEKEINFISPGKAYLLKKKKEELLNTVVNKKLNKFSQDSFERLSKYSIQTRINKLLPKEVTERKDDMILNTAFLVDKEEVGSFVSLTELLNVTYEESGLFFDCTGPWPPYNFCNVIASIAAQSQR